MESLLGSPMALSFRVRGSVGHNFKHLILINVKFVRRTSQERLRQRSKNKRTTYTKH